MTEPDAIQRARKAVRGRYGADAIAVQAGLICELISLASLAKPQPVGGALTEQAYWQGWCEAADWSGRDDLYADRDSGAYANAMRRRLATLSAPVAQPGEAVNDEAMPPLYRVHLDRSYDQRAKAIIAFNTCKGDLDDKLEAAWTATLKTGAPIAAQPGGNPR